jgi:hypothetical protein
MFVPDICGIRLPRTSFSFARPVIRPLWYASSTNAWTSGIHKGLKLLFADEASATRWLTSPNRDLPFGGISPLERALRGSIDDFYAVRRYIDARRGMK